jgi:hypothetical protein
MIDDYDFIGRRVVLLGWVWFGINPEFFYFFFIKIFLKGDLKV